MISIISSTPAPYKIVDGVAKSRELFTLAGLSSDAKPVTEYKGILIRNGSTFIEIDTGKAYMYDEEGRKWSAQAGGAGKTSSGSMDLSAALDAAIASQVNNARVLSLTETQLASGSVIEAVGVPAYVGDVTQYAAYGISETGWYIFARVLTKSGEAIEAGVTVEGADGSIITAGEDHVDIAVRFEVASMSKPVTINWGTYTETYIFKATDLAVRNLDYRVTFYVYDADPFATWEYELTTDTTFETGKHYFTKNEDGTYTEAEVTVGEAVPADTYYKHSKVTIEGLCRNITYRLNTVVDCPMTFILPEIEDECHGAWYEIRCNHAGTYSMTLVPPSDDVKVATQHSQVESAGINMINLHYTSVAGLKMWRFMNTHSSVPA